MAQKGTGLFGLAGSQRCASRETLLSPAADPLNAAGSGDQALSLHGVWE